MRENVSTAWSDFAAQGQGQCFIPSSSFSSAFVAVCEAQGEENRPRVLFFLRGLFSCLLLSWPSKGKIRKSHTQNFHSRRQNLFVCFSVGGFAWLPAVAIVMGSFMDGTFCSPFHDEKLLTRLIGHDEFLGISSWPDEDTELPMSGRAQLKTKSGIS